jgi:tRNA U55 pseudouridine synthase TruB
LRRLYVEPFASEPMHGLEALEAACGAGDPAAALLPADWPLAALPAVRLTAPEAQRLLHGQCIERPADDALAAPTRGVHLRIYDADGRFLGIGEAGGEGAVRPRRLLNAVAPV